MNFEKRMKKHGMKNLNSIVPNPYPPVEPQRSFPFWAKIATPLGSLLLAASVVGAIVIPVALNRGNEENPVELSSVAPQTSYPTNPNVTPNVTLVGAPKLNYVPEMDSKIVSRTGPKALENLCPYLTDSKNKNFTISPASYLLCASALAAVSDGFDLNAYGLVDAKDDTKALLENWNSSYGTKNQTTGAEYNWCSFKSGVLHQQVGGTYAFDDAKRQQVEDAYIATSVARLGEHCQQAQQYFKDAVDLTIPVPDADMPGDGVLTYGALTMMDLAMQTYETSKNPFVVDGRTISVDTGYYGTEEKPVGVKYFEGETYLAFSFRIYCTDLMVVLPNEGVSLESVPLLEAYNEIALNRRVASGRAYGYIPYFHLSNYSFDVRSAFLDHMTGNEKLYSKLLRNSHLGVGPYFRAYQSTDFELCDKGVYGQSVTVAGSGSGATSSKNPILINVNRPFYAVCLKDGFPLFVNKVNNPSIRSAA